MTQFNPIEEMTLEGFQIVSSNMFVHLPRKSDATCTIWPTRISFSKLALEYLHFCEYIKLQVNPKTKCLLVMPVTSTDKDSIRWAKGDKDKTVRNMESRIFGEQLYQSWGLDPEYNYRSIGRLVSVNQKVMLLFDFSQPEMWKAKKPEA